MIRLLLSCLFVSFNTFAIDKIERDTLDEALTWIDKYTLEKDFIKATRYHFNGTKFFSHEIIDGKEVVSVYSAEEVMPMIKSYFENDSIASDVDEISEEVTISNDGLSAKSISENSVVITNSLGKYRAHNISTIVFGIHNNKLVVTESHDKQISIERL